MREEELQQLEFLICKLHARTVCRDGMLVQIDKQAARFQQVLDGLRLDAAEHGLDAGHQLHDAERLRQVIVRAEVEALNFIIFRAAGRRHDDGDRGHARVCADAAQQLDAVDPRQHHVEHDQLRQRRTLQGIPEGRAILKAARLKARGL